MRERVRERIGFFCDSHPVQLLLQFLFASSGTGTFTILVTSKKCWLHERRKEVEKNTQREREREGE